MSIAKVKSGNRNIIMGERSDGCVFSCVFYFLYLIATGVIPQSLVPLVCFKKK